MQIRTGQDLILTHSLLLGERLLLFARLRFIAAAGIVTAALFATYIVGIRELNVGALTAAAAFLAVSRSRDGAAGDVDGVRRRERPAARSGGRKSGGGCSARSALRAAYTVRPGTRARGRSSASRGHRQLFVECVQVRGETRHGCARCSPSSGHGPHRGDRRWPWNRRGPTRSPFSRVQSAKEIRLWSRRHRAWTLHRSPDNASSRRPSRRRKRGRAGECFLSRSTRRMTAARSGLRRTRRTGRVAV